MFAHHFLAGLDWGETCGSGSFPGGNILFGMFRRTPGMDGVLSLAEMNLSAARKLRGQTTILVRDLQTAGVTTL
jgi:hypothetical protein